MKETDGWVKIKKYTDDEGKPVCGECIHFHFESSQGKTCKLGMNGGNDPFPGPTCPVWHGESKSERAYVCIHCEAVYLEEPVTQCDCLKGSGADFVEAVLIYTLPPQENKP